MQDLHNNENRLEETHESQGQGYAQQVNVVEPYWGLGAMLIQGGELR